MSGEEGALRDLHAALARLSERLDELGRRLTASPAPEPSPPAGTLLDEGERRRLAGLRALLAVGPESGADQALRLALDRAVHRAGADVAAVLVPTREGRLLVAATIGFGPALPPGEVTDGIAVRALQQGEAVRGQAEDADRDPLILACSLAAAMAIPVPGGVAPVLGVLFAGRRRPAPFTGGSLQILALLADRIGAVLAEGDRPRSAVVAPPAVAPPVVAPPFSANLDLDRAARAVATAVAERLGGAAVALLLPDSGVLGVAAVVGAPGPASGVDAALPIVAGEGLLGGVVQSRRAWLANEGGGDAGLARLLGSPPQLIVPLLADDRLVALLAAGADRALEPGPLTPILADAAAAIHNARLYRDAVLGLAEARSARPLVDAPAPARDFANLLAVVLGRLTALRDRLKDADAVRDLDVAEEAAWRAAEGIRGLLGFAPGQRAAPLAPLNVAQVVRDAVEQARARWALRDAPRPAVKLDIEAVPPVRGSADDLQEAVDHVLENAAEAAPRGEAIAVRVAWDGGGRVDVTVEDHGPGMDDAVRARALEPFFSTKGSARLGLGLPVVHAIVARHRGRLQLQSTPGAGTIVRIALPTIASGRRPVGATSPVARVLVVEDEPAVREALVEALTQQGHVARVAADGRAALEIVEREPVDAVVTDLALPGMSGLEVARAVKHLRPGTPVLLVTAWPVGADAARLETSGVDAVVEKPVGLSEFRATLALILARRGSSEP